MNFMPGEDAEALRAAVLRSLPGQLTGADEFTEVYPAEVRVPAGDLLGEAGQGWQVAMTTLANQRVWIGARPAERGAGPVAQAVQVYRRAAAEGRADAAMAERLMLLCTKAEAARLGLPGEPRADRDLPWRQLRRS